MGFARRASRLAGSATIVLALGGCARATIREPELAPQGTHRAWTHTFLWGLVGDSEVDVRYYCPAKPARVKTGGDAASTLIGLATLGIYLPRVVTVTCSAPRAAQAAPRPTRVDE